MNTLLFTMSRDEDDKYRIPANSITVDDQSINHPEIASQSMLELLYGPGEHNTSLNGDLFKLGTWKAGTKACEIALKTELTAGIKIPFRIASPWPIEDEPTVDIMALFDARNAARQAKDFKRADSIRDELKQRGWMIKDTPNGPKLTKLP
jgi:hypothetical protein